ncbi:hypothetical protein NDU88_004415 [Pleurodeles waltl]|uniref:Uncharacterized protein n=1 Tax=Pleurodeles waltl TaxID=8319 RepID=A0AAV7TR71_PLEWA|nr:hypothetical protein NDU88_004415 [Pleurodeles waltl]
MPTGVPGIMVMAQKGVEKVTLNISWLQKATFVEPPGEISDLDNNNCGSPRDEQEPRDMTVSDRVPGQGTSRSRR